MTFASGGTFSKFSHEFQTLSDAGEDTIYIYKDKKIAVNKEVFVDEVKKELGLGDDYEEARAVEVGNIFTLGTKFSEPFDLKYKNEKGEENFVFMGSYGIGLGRLMGTVVEVLSDDKGIVWPKEISPFAVHLVRLGDKEETVSFADKIYKDLGSRGVEVLYDDRDLRAGEKFADSDLIGIPVRFIISDKTVADTKIEVKKRTETESKLMSEEEAVKEISNS
jgi:prolyl-tRNA synthetase